MHAVAKRWGVGYSTILEACTRRTGISSTEEFERLFQAWQEGSREFCQRIMACSPSGVRGEVKRLLGSPPPAREEFATVSFPLPVRYIGRLEAAAAIAEIPRQVWLVKVVMKAIREQLAAAGCEE
jgi:hypothetical protein